MKYGFITTSLLTGQDGMNNKEMREIDGRLQECYNYMIKRVTMIASQNYISILKGLVHHFTAIDD